MAHSSVNEVPSPSQMLARLSKEAGLNVESREFAQYLDSVDELNGVREEFHYPKKDTLPAVDRMVEMNPKDDCTFT